MTQTDPGLKGDTASGGGTKPATLETGVVVQVPLFIEEGERVRVDARSGQYVSRASGRGVRPIGSVALQVAPPPDVLGPMKRSDQRRDAVFALYQHEITGRPLGELLEGAKPFTRELAEGVAANRDELDDLISRHSTGWSLERIAPLERSIMRAPHEALHREDVPVEVAIDEAELAKRYCGADAPGFVNGVLGAALEERGAVD